MDYYQEIKDNVFPYWSTNASYLIWTFRSPCNQWQRPNWHDWIFVEIVMKGFSGWCSAFIVWIWFCEKAISYKMFDVSVCPEKLAHQLNTYLQWATNGVAGRNVNWQFEWCISKEIKLIQRTAIHVGWWLPYVAVHESGIPRWIMKADDRQRIQRQIRWYKQQSLCCSALN